ncbi:hypothetical protein Ccrd_011395 [Cynara cardunculus var. scolymus]|uniref:Protein DEFECTIVE IN MERISTEM SILENCING 3 n=1 Tax=Cynara cardunculus var. scolymus TaxID=59895 RepID=A0A118K651_CYNCS|nr:hypothetical protein Ccrd_011395 [Cynara cardunculus var. scolymus]
MPVHAKLLNVQVPSAINYVGQNDSSHVATDGVANSALSQAESLVYSSKKLENELLMLGQNIKHHEENIKYLKTRINSLDDQITDMQVTLGTPRISSAPMTEDEDFSHKRDEQATVEHLMQHEKSAAGIVCQMKYLGTQADPTSSSHNVLGVVATLGKVSDDNLSRLLSEYLGLDTMLALVCMTNDGVEALETNDKEGFPSKSFGLHGLGASTGRTMDGVICLENLRPYVGEFMPDDPQRRLALLKPKLPNGESPAGFLGFAVNMIHFDNAHLNTLTTDGHGIRETLFYTLFSKLQVYRTRAHMLQALPFISDGAISLDGAIIRRNGVFGFGNQEEMDVKFAVRSYPPENLVETEKQMKKLKQKKETTTEDLQREEAFLAHVKYNFEVKKQEFVRFMAQSSPTQFKQLQGDRLLDDDDSMKAGNT